MSTTTSNNTMTKEQFVNAMQALALDRGAMAEVLGVTPQAVRFWELGERAVPPTVSRLIIIFQKYPGLLKEI